MFQLGKIVPGHDRLYGPPPSATSCGNAFRLPIILGRRHRLALITVVGQCVGAQRYEEAKRYIHKLTGLAYLFMFFFSMLFDRQILAAHYKSSDFFSLFLCPRQPTPPSRSCCGTACSCGLLARCLPTACQTAPHCGQRRSLHHRLDSVDVDLPHLRGGAFWALCSAWARWAPGLPCSWTGLSAFVFFAVRLHSTNGSTASCSKKWLPSINNTQKDLSIPGQVLFTSDYFEAIPGPKL